MSYSSHKSYTSHHPQGFTLIELLVYTAVLSFILVFSVQFGLSLLDSTARSGAKEEVQVNTALMIQSFDYEVRNAQAVYTPASDFIGDPGQLSLVSSHGLAPDEDESYVDLYLDNGRFCARYELTGVVCKTSQNIEVTSLHFTKIVQSGGAESVQMRAALRYRSPRSEYQYPESIRAAARLRDY